MLDTNHDKASRHRIGKPSLISRMRCQYAPGKAIYLNLLVRYDVQGFSLDEREDIDESLIEKLLTEGLQIPKEESTLPSQWTMMQWLRSSLQHSQFLQMSDRTDSEAAPTQEQSDRFQRLARQWRDTRGPSSLVRDLVLNEAYQSIIGMGSAAVPMILAELATRPDHWFWALRAITGANPVKPEQRGRLREMAEAWLDWGREQGYWS